MSWFVALLVAAPGLEALTLEQAVARAHAGTPRLAAVRSAVERAEAVVVQSRAAWLPTLTLNATFTQLEGNRGLADRVLVPAQSASGNLQLVFPLLAVPRWMSTGDAERAVDVARLDETETRRAVTSLVSRAWLNVALQRALVGIAERAKSTCSQQVELAQLRASGGLGTKLDLARSKRELADAQARWARAQADLVTAQEVLGVLVGSNTPLDVAGTPTVPAPATGELEEVVARRPDVIVARARAELAQRVVDRSWTDYLPTASVVVQPTVQAPATPTQPAIGLSAQLVAQAALFDGLARKGTAQERRAALSLAKTQLEEVEQRARSEVRTASASVQLRAQASVASAEVSVHALEAERLAQIAWKEGATTNVELVEAERAARDAEAFAELAKTNELAARVEWWVAAGHLDFEKTGVGQE